MSALGAVERHRQEVESGGSPRAGQGQVAESDEVEARVARGGGGGSGAATQIVRVEPDGARLAVPERPRLRAR